MSLSTAEWAGVAGAGILVACGGTYWLLNWVESWKRARKFLREEEARAAARLADPVELTAAEQDAWERIAGHEEPARNGDAP